MALNRVWMPSPCYHGRNTGGVRIIVLHTAEGATTIESLGNFFANYNNQVSSHVGADDKRGKVGEYVTRGNAAWTQANYNNAAVSMELCGFAKWSRSTWLDHHHNMLRNCADWIAEESKKFGIPITALSDSAAQGGGRGVCQHIDLGPGGSGHVDCGSGFPFDVVLDWARGGAPAEDKARDWEERFMWLQFDPGNPDPDANEAPACTLAIPNELSKGKHKIRFACRRAADLRVLTTAGKTEVHIEAQGALSVAIPDGCRSVTVKLDSDHVAGVPASPISATISEQ